MGNVSTSLLKEAKNRTVRAFRNSGKENNRSSISELFFLRSSGESLSRAARVCFRSNFFNGNHSETRIDTDETGKQA
jgi:hypothetical protein